jgi:hypothetical protein
VCSGGGGEGGVNLAWRMKLKLGRMVVMGFGMGNERLKTGLSMIVRFLLGRSIASSQRVCLVHQ